MACGNNAGFLAQIEDLDLSRNLAWVMSVRSNYSFCKLFIIVSLRNFHPGKRHPSMMLVRKAAKTRRTGSRVMIICFGPTESAIIHYDINQHLSP
jgi:hypothetical protein